MPCIKTQWDLENDVAFAYETEIVMEPGAGPKLLQRVIGFEDPDTGKIICTETDSNQDTVLVAAQQNRVQGLNGEALTMEARMQALVDENRCLRNEVQRFRKQFGTVERFLYEAENSMMGVLDLMDLGIGGCKVDDINAGTV